MGVHGDGGGGLVSLMGFEFPFRSLGGLCHPHCRRPRDHAILFKKESILDESRLSRVGFRAQRLDFVSSREYF